MKKAFVITLLVFTFYGAMAQKPYAVINHVALQVSNLDKSVAFYKDLFHLDTIPNPFVKLKVTWFKIGGHEQLHLIQADPGERVPKPGNFHFCFSVHDIGEFIGRLKKENIAYADGDGKPFAITIRGDGVKQIYIADPDGYQVEINDQAY